MYCEFKIIFQILREYIIILKVYFEFQKYKNLLKQVPSMRLISIGEFFSVYNKTKKIVL